ncbi:protein folded gastrulation [Episyrphus balteatus]|uniref:protein folded gastrulation n=1 Tax=Episyrphus balteatus TaxID=286459 RepID=UPI0024862D6B|nr:protein folded gastrulation [Episyrphus balteatus]XP_055844311.1 protein folded gastrulation [Episyrphus balteatus]
MLLDISKLLLLILQIITTTTLIHIILLTTYCSSVNTLPITSKPIESTAENLAWEAWLMVPVGQQQKSRKVTPKSIFIVPHKNNQTSTCPPGEHWSQNRCIPTVNIDTDKALLNQLSHLAPFSLDYDYDYEEEGNLTPGAEKLEGSADTNPFSVGEFVDEPLKFNIFSETFPIGSSGSGDSSGSKDSEDDNVFFVSDRRRRPPTPPEISLPDLDTDSSNYGPSNQSGNNGDGSSLFLSGIDAILVPAVSENQGKDQNMSFSIYQEPINSTVSSLTSPSDDERNHELDEILENESLILDRNGARVNITSILTSTTTEKNDAKLSSSTNWETTTMKLEEEYEDAESKTEFTRSVTDLPPNEEETSQPTNFEKDSTSTVVVPKEDTTLITEPKEDITTITSPKEELTTIEITSSKEADITTISTLPNVEETTTITVAKEEIVGSPKEVITTTDLPKEETSESEDPPTINEETDLLPKPSDSNDRFVYHQLTEEDALPQVINIVEELRKINDLVARNSRPTTTTPIPSATTTTTIQTPSEEGITNQNDLLSKIIFPTNTIKTSSEDPVPPTSTSTVWSSNSTSRNILSKNSSSSSSGSSSMSTVSSTEESQESTSDPSSSTSQKPEINEPDPYWWLPSGWSTERTEADRPLLLRFWSAISGISGSQTKV